MFSSDPMPRLLVPIRIGCGLLAAGLLAGSGGWLLAAEERFSSVTDELRKNGSEIRLGGGGTKPEEPAYNYDLERSASDPNRAKAQSLVSQLRASQSMSLASAYENSLKSTVSNQARSELQAAALLFSGQLEEGLLRLLALESKDPKTSASLAGKITIAYELNKDNRKAMQWARERMERDPAANEGTEWLRLLIIQANTRLAQDPNWLKTRHVLDVKLKDLEAPDFAYRVLDLKLNRRDLQVALLTQLKERMMWVKPRDPVVADLLYTFSVVQQSAEEFESAQGLLQLAQAYGYPVTSRMLAEIRLRF